MVPTRRSTRGRHFVFNRKGGDDGVHRRTIEPEGGIGKCTYFYYGKLMDGTEFALAEFSNRLPDEEEFSVWRLREALREKTDD